MSKKVQHLSCCVRAVFICSFASPNFLSSTNLTNISRQLAVTTILAFGETILIISDMLDLSSGAVLALSGVFAVLVFKAKNSLLISFMVGVLTSVACNVLNGAMVTTFKAPALIASLAAGNGARSYAVFYKRPEYPPAWRIYGVWPGCSPWDSYLDHFSGYHYGYSIVHLKTYKIRTLTVCDWRKRRSLSRIRY